jgi:N-formylglutamate deformylase
MAEVIHGDGWSVRKGSGPVVATAIHNGHAMSRDVAELTALGEEERFREEDPYTGQFAEVVETCVIVHQSRFELDLNRPPELAVYKGPEDAWGLKVWKSPLPAEVIRRSLGRRREFYREVGELLREKQREYGSFVVLDIHSYNHRRNGGDQPPEPTGENPDINLGTGSLDREAWSDVIEAVMTTIRSFDRAGRTLDVRENVKFRGGEFSRWIHRRFPGTGCALALELKKVFMNEWTGELDPGMVVAYREMIRDVVPVIEKTIVRR